VGIPAPDARWCFADSSRTTELAGRGAWKGPRRAGGALRYNGLPALRSTRLRPSNNDARVRFPTRGLRWGRPRMRLVLS
jgi:hypothetical protein